MKHKINVRLILTAVLGVLATLVSMTLIYYTLFQRQVRKDLQVNAQILSEAGIFTKESGSTEFEKNFHIDVRSFGSHGLIQTERSCTTMMPVPTVLLIMRTVRT